MIKLMFLKRNAFFHSNTHVKIDLTIIQRKPKIVYYLSDCRVASEPCRIGARDALYFLRYLFIYYIFILSNRFDGLFDASLKLAEYSCPHGSTSRTR